MKHKKITRAISKCIAVGFVGIQVSQAGNIITVDSTSDQPESGLTTLREAIAAGNSTSGAVINFDPEVFAEPQTITLQNGELNIRSSVTINGPGVETLTIDGDESSRIFRIDDDTDAIQNVTINDLTLTNGKTDLPTPGRNGGCVLSFEALSLNNSTVTSCESAGRGGGVFSRYGSLSLNNSTVSNNQAGNDGGGLYFREVAAVIAYSTISGNTADFSGGGIYETRYSDIQLLNSTISNNLLINAENEHGGGIFIKGKSTPLSLKNTTVFNNTGEGIYIRNTSLVNISNSIIAGNTNGDCYFSQINANSYNQNNLDTDGSCDVNAINHITVADPMLEALAHFGGDTETHRPQVGSPVIDVGDDALCLALDQRGEARPQDGDGDGTADCDIGAVELSLTDDTIFIDGFDN